MNLQPNTSPLLDDIMTLNPIEIESHSSLIEAPELMQQHDIDHLAVMGGKGPSANPESVVSSADILKVTQLGGRILDDCQLEVDDMCTGKTYIANSKDFLHIPL